MKKRKMDEEYNIKVKSIICFIIYMAVSVIGMLTIEFANPYQRSIFDAVTLALFTQYINYEYILKKVRPFYFDLIIIIIWLIDLLMNFSQIK